MRTIGRIPVQAALLAALLIASTPPSLGAIPAFARRYKVTCSLCHAPFPKLNAFGEQFAANGFRMSSAEYPVDTVNTGDPLLDLARELPLAIRLEAYAQSYARSGRVVTDFHTPYGLKLLSGGTISKGISYYFYTFLAERGDPGAVEDAFVYLNNVAGAPVDVVVGQFQISDPLFKRELRLEFEDYAVYRARIADIPFDLTYDRGVTASVDLAGFTVTGEIVNGVGLGGAQPDRHFDDDANKNLFVHVTRDIAAPLRLGALGYYGKRTDTGVNNNTTMLGADATVASGIVELNAQYIHREDDNPTFTVGEAEARLDGGFGEVILRPEGSRWYGYGLYNLVKTNRPLLDVRLGGPSGIDRYHTISGGVGFLARRNLRWTGEVTYDIEREEARFSLGTVLGF